LTNDIADVVGDLEFAVSTSALGVHHSLRNPFTVKVCQKIDQMEVLQQEWAVWAHALSGLGVHDLYEVCIRSKGSKGWKEIDCTGHPLEAV